MTVSTRRGALLLALTLPVPTDARPADEACTQGNGARTTLLDAIRMEALPVLREWNHLGLRDEAGRISDWIGAPVRGRGGDLRLAGACLSDAGGSELRLTPEMAAALRRLNDWYGMAPATLARPVTHEELRAAALSPGSVARIAALFEESLRRAVLLAGRWRVPETGGEASLDEELRLFATSDPAWSAVQELARRMHEPKRIAALWKERPADLWPLDPHGLLRTSLERLALGLPSADDAVRRAALTVAENAAQAWSIGPEAQFSLIVGTDWRGRYVGRWHTHPPHDQDDGWSAGDVPSFEDMQNAVDAGQFLTLSFQPDGFDLYDASALERARRADLSLLKVVRHRSPSWRERFRKLHARMADPR